MLSPRRPSSSRRSPCRRLKQVVFRSRSPTLVGPSQPSSSPPRAEPEGARESPTDFTFLTVRARTRARARVASVLVSRLIPCACHSADRHTEYRCRRRALARHARRYREPVHVRAAHVALGRVRRACRLPASQGGRQNPGHRPRRSGAQAPARLWHHAGAPRERRRGATTKTRS